MYDEEKDESLAKSYVDLLQIYSDQLSVFEAVVTNAEKTREKIITLEEELLKRGFKINELQEKVNESKSDKSW